MLSSAAFAQEAGQITGTVTDPVGATVPNATVTVKNLGTNAARTVTTNDSGSYVITGLSPAMYELSTTAGSGFTRSVSKVEVTVGGKLTVDVRLTLGQTSTTVEVSGDSVGQVNTSSQEISQVITPRQITELPTLTRNPYDFVVLSGNTSADPNVATVRGVGVSLNGQRSAGTEVLLDGVENADNYGAAVGVTIPLDSVQEYRIISNGFDAQYGRASGGIVNLVTKSGSNAFHGSLYAYNRVSALAANTYYEDSVNALNRQQGLPGLPADHFTRNQFGYSVGGPILKDKLFFFSNTEWNRIRSSSTQTFEIPSASFLASSSATTRTYFNSYGKLASNAKLGATIPVAGFASNPLQIASVTAPVNAGAGSPLNSWFGVNRFDYNLNNKIMMSFRASDFADTYQAGYNSLSPYDGYTTGQTDFNQAYLYSLTYAVSPNLISSSKVSFSRINTNQPLGPAGVVPGSYLNSANTQSVDSGTGNPIALPGYLPLSPGNALPFGGPANTYQFDQDFAYTRGAHTVHAGGAFLQIRDNRTFGAYETAVQQIAKNGTSLGASLAALQAGNIYSFEVALNPQGKLPCSYNASGTLNVTAACSISLPAASPSFTRQNTFNDASWYVQDSWKFNSRLTLNYGIRWEYYGVQHNHDPNLESNFFLGTGTNLVQQIATGQVATTPNSPVGGLVKKNLNNYAPRVGFAYDVFGDGKWSVRGGYGISYERNFGNVTYNVIQNPPNYAGVTLTSSKTTQYQLATSNFGVFSGSSGTVGLAPPSLRALQQNMPTAYTHQYSLGVEHEVLPNDLVAVEYSGAHGVHLYSIANVNGIGYGTFIGNAGGYATNRINHQYGAINIREANGSSHYDAVNVRLNANNLQRYGLQLTANYTVAHALDNLSTTFSESSNNQNLGYLNPFNPRLDYGNADFDTRQRFTIGGVYQPTFLEFRQNRIAHAVVGGLEFAPIATLRTGTPYTVYDCTNAANGCPRVVPATGLGFHGKVGAPTGAGTFDYLAVPVAAANPFTNSQGYSDFPDVLGGYQNTGINRNQWYSPNNATFDLGVYKNIHLGKADRYTVQLRGEFYNVLNHHNNYVQAATAEYSSLTNGGTADGNLNVIRGAPSGNPGGTTTQPDERRNVQLAARFSF